MRSIKKTLEILGIELSEKEIKKLEHIEAEVDNLFYNYFRR